MRAERVQSTCVRIFIALAALLCLAAGDALPAQNAQFDLQGPTLEVKVQRAGKSLPIAETPSLQEGDRLWLHPVLGQHESVHYLMVVAFLRGSTNPPPDEWFHKVEAWDKKVVAEGVYLPVPPGAQQVTVLFAPQTGGDFSALKNAVRGRPGAFVRASQDLNLASRDRERINTYLKALRGIEDPDQIKPRSQTLARSLALKLNQDCFQRPADQQAACLQQSQSALILENGTSSMAQGLLSGPTSDLALQAGSTVGATAGLYDPYISVALDIGRILATFHTAQYQYIPALSDADATEMNLWLNAPPSFHNPKSVLVVALPPVEATHLPQLRPVDPKQVYCMQQAPLILPVDGAPAIFSTQYGHGLALHLAGSGGKGVDVPVSADPSQGGFVVPPALLKEAALGREVEAKVQGFWGFDAYSGPSFQLRSTDGADWTVADADRNALVVGRDDEIHLRSNAAACVESVTFRDGNGQQRQAPWKLDGTDGITATLPLKDAQPGTVLIAVKQFGLPAPKALAVPSFAEAGKYEAFTIHAGDNSGVLVGSRLDEVAELGLKDGRFRPGKLTRSSGVDSLEMVAEAASAGSSAGSLEAGSKTAGQVTLKDGRVVAVPVVVGDARPSVALLNKNVDLAASPQPPPPIALKLGTPDELPLSGRLTFAVKTQAPLSFARDEAIEIATEDGLSSVTLTLASGQLVLQDAKTAIGTLDPLKSFGASAFGRLHLRPVLRDGTIGNWVPLATLVRLPTFQSYSCSGDAAQTCTLAGTNLFLLNAVAANPAFTDPVTIPDGFALSTLEVPRASNGQLFAKLRDDPAVVSTVTVDTATRAAVHRRHTSPGLDAVESREGRPSEESTPASGGGTR